MQSVERYVICPGCGLKLPGKNLPKPEHFNASGECRDLYHELSFYTLNKGDNDFIHEVIVDTYGAQHAGPLAKNMSTFFAVAGLYLYLERRYTGKEARQAHVTMAQHKRYNWPTLLPPTDKYRVTIKDVIAATDKDAAIHQWAMCTWGCGKKTGIQF